jgi:NAD(P)H-dependent FMN reductase
MSTIATKDRTRKLVGIAGSLRADSYSKAVLRTLAEISWEGVEIEMCDISSIPLYNADQDGEHPPDPVQKLKNSIAGCAGILVVSPEYNYGIPGVLKNALDWASRPAYTSPLVGKPVGIITCSVATTGGVRAQAAIRDCFYACLAEVVPYMEIAIPTVQDKVQGGKLTDEKSLALASGLVNALALASRGEASNGKRIFLAGASGVIGQRLIPRLVQAGHVVGGLTRSPSKTELLSHLGAEPILCDVFDREALIQAVRDFEPDVVLDELTDLPDDAAQISELAGLNARIRTEGTQNLIQAARRSGSPKILAQSVAWQLPDGPDAQAVAELERSVLAESGVVLRYGQFYGPGTYNPQQPPEAPRVQIDRAAERTVEALGEPTGVVVIID